MKFRSILFVLVCTMFSTAFAESEKSKQNDEHMGPPKAAIEACQSKGEGDACDFTGPMGRHREGTCKKGPQGEGVLACAPKPPKEALDACQGKKDGDTCSFTGKKDKNVSGNCKSLPRLGEVACVPERMQKRMEERRERREKR